jgi:hypothetical protein
MGCVAPVIIMGARAEDTLDGEAVVGNEGVQILPVCPADTGIHQYDILFVETIQPYDGTFAFDCVSVSADMPQFHGRSLL